MINCTSRNIPPYAILSHTWMGDDDEVSYEDWSASIAESKAGYAKIRSCAEQAVRDGLEHIWADTCCIQKSSSAELSEAINSMYAWYQDATTCYAFLSDVPSKQEFASSKWFTRGWTLQELIAPTKLVFFDETWTPLGSRTDLQRAVSECTGIPSSVLSGAEHFETFSIAQRMSWAANRVTTRVEDIAYCMLGLFDINMPLIYGEGENAFMRLQEEILKISEDHSIFAWRSHDARGGCLATSPSAFSMSSNIVQSNPFGVHNEPTIVSSSGIHLHVPLIASIAGRRGVAILNCIDGGFGDKYVAIIVRDMTLTMNRFERIRSNEFRFFNMRNLRKTMDSITRLCIQKGRIRRVATLEVAKGNADGILDLNPVSASLFEAAAARQDDEVWFFLSNRKTDINAVDNNGMSALHHAASTGTVTTMRMLLGRPDIQLEQTAMKLTPLYLAAAAGNVLVVRMLFDTGHRDVSLRHKNGWTPFEIAARNGHEAVVKLMVDEKDKIEIDRKGVNDRTPLSWAAEEGHEAVARFLLSTGRVDIESKSDKGWKPLTFAARSGHEGVVATLCGAYNANVDTEDHTGRTPLSHAIENGHEGVVRYLLATKNVNVNSMDNLGRSPLMWAVRNKHEGVIRLILSTGKVDKVPRSVKKLK